MKVDNEIRALLEHDLNGLSYEGFVRNESPNWEGHTIATVLDKYSMPYTQHFFDGNVVQPQIIGYTDENDSTRHNLQPVNKVIDAYENNPKSEPIRNFDEGELLDFTGLWPGTLISLQAESISKINSLYLPRLKYYFGVIAKAEDDNLYLQVKEHKKDTDQVVNRRHESRPLSAIPVGEIRHFKKESSKHIDIDMLERVFYAQILHIPSPVREIESPKTTGSTLGFFHRLGFRR